MQQAIARHSRGVATGAAAPASAGAGTAAEGSTEAGPTFDLACPICQTTHLKLQQVCELWHAWPSVTTVLACAPLAQPVSAASPRLPGTPCLLPAARCLVPLLLPRLPVWQVNGSPSGDLRCPRCARRFAANATFADLTLTSGVESSAYKQRLWGGTTTFQSPLVSFVYERGWRQGFAWAGGWRRAGRAHGVRERGTTGRGPPSSTWAPRTRGRGGGGLGGQQHDIDMASWPFSSRPCSSPQCSVPAPWLPCRLPRRRQGVRAGHGLPAARVWRGAGGHELRLGAVHAAVSGGGGGRAGVRLGRAGSEAAVGSRGGPRRPPWMRPGCPLGGHASTDEGAPGVPCLWLPSSRAAQSLIPTPLHPPCSFLKSNRFQGVIAADFRCRHRTCSCMRTWHCIAPQVARLSALPTP